jgi:hypothetical protein
MDFLNRLLGLIAIDRSCDEIGFKANLAYLQVDKIEYLITLI